MVGTPEAEHHVDDELVRSLLSEQHSDLASLTIELVDAGWDNFMFRLGDAYTVRLPRRLPAVSLIINEQQWLPIISRNLPIPVPAPVRIGRPGPSYPWPWSILPWLKGSPANEMPPDAAQAPGFAEFLKALHQPAPANAPLNAVRGCPLRDRAEGVAARLAHLSRTTQAIVPEIISAWETALDAPLADEARWLHGDLHARNVLTDRGTISAIIDWGDITSGDVATDLGGIWALFDDADARRTALQTYAATESQIARARGWAVNIGTVLLATGLVDNPRHAAMGSDTLRRVVEDFATP